MAASQLGSWDRSTEGVSTSWLLQLPLEVRCRVYRLVFGSAAIHLIYLDNRLCHTRCINLYPHPELHHGRLSCPQADRVAIQIGRRKRAEETPQHAIAVPLPDALDVTHVALLRTCRQVNDEASPVLYSSLVFHASGSEGWIEFATRLRPATLASVRTLIITLRSDGPKGTPLAEEFWSLVANHMAGLRYLDVNIIYTQGRLRRELWPAWIQPMLRVRGLNTFNLGIWDGHDASTVEKAFAETVRGIVCS